MLVEIHNFIQMLHLFYSLLFGHTIAPIKCNLACSSISPYQASYDEFKEKSNLDHCMKKLYFLEKLHATTYFL